MTELSRDSRCWKTAAPCVAGAGYAKHTPFLAFMPVSLAWRHLDRQEQIQVSRRTLASTLRRQRRIYFGEDAAVQECDGPRQPRRLRQGRAWELARKYVWWQPPAETLVDRRLLLAQIMTLGTVDDVRWLLSVAAGDDLRAVLRDPPVGIFNARSWSFWHLRLGFDAAPELPGRRPPR